MTFGKVWSTTWACEPAIAAAHIEAVVWTSVAGLLTEERDRLNPYRKIVEVRKGSMVILNVLCLPARRHGTTVEFLSPRRRSVMRDELIAELIMRTRQREVEQNLVGRSIGFVPYEAAK